MSEPQGELALAKALAKALAELPTPRAPDQIWQRLQHSLDRHEPAPRRWRHWLTNWRPSFTPTLGLAAACGAALFLWFGGVNDFGRNVDRDPQPDQRTPVSRSADEQDIARLQLVSAQLEAQLGSRRADSTLYDDDMAWTEATIAAALAEVDRKLASAPSAPETRELWVRRVALLAGLNEQAQDPLPLGRVDWVQVD